MNGPHSDRGQLVLAGAISFALILIAIAVVFSTTLFTASVGSSGTVETVSDGTGTEQTVESATTGILERVNRQNDWLLTQNRTFVDRSSVPDSQLEPHLRSNVSRHDLLLAESKSASGPTFVSTSVGPVQDGTRVTQGWDSLGPTGDMVNDRLIADFAMMVNTSQSSGGTVTVTAEGAGSDTTEVVLHHDDTADELEVQSTDGGGNSQSCSIPPTDDGVVYVDLTSGYATETPFDPESRRHGCLSGLTEGIEGPYDVTVAADPDVHMAYDYTVNGSAVVGSALPSTSSEDVLWSTDVSLVYETPNVVRESTIEEVSSYDP